MLWDRVRMAWAMLAGRRNPGVRAGRSREEPGSAPDAEHAIAKPGYVEEALPWLDAIYGFALRLTQGDTDQAEDLVQETFLRAYRSWHTFERGTNAKAWLFTICRNTFLRERERVGSRREYAETVLDMETRAVTDAHGPHPEKDFFDGRIDDEVVRAIDQLPEEFREVLVLSDLGDLRYAEIAEVLEIPVGTVKSRLFRARRVLQDALRDYAVGASYLQEDRS